MFYLFDKIYFKNFLLSKCNESHPKNRQRMHKDHKLI